MRDPSRRRGGPVAALLETESHLGRPALRSHPDHLELDAGTHRRIGERDHHGEHESGATGLRGADAQRIADLDVLAVEVAHELTERAVTFPEHGGHGPAGALHAQHHVSVDVERPMQRADPRDEVMRGRARIRGHVLVFGDDRLGTSGRFRQLRDQPGIDVAQRGRGVDGHPEVLAEVVGQRQDRVVVTRALVEQRQHHAANAIGDGEPAFGSERRGTILSDLRAQGLQHLPDLGEILRAGRLRHLRQPCLRGRAVDDARLAVVGRNVAT